MLKSAVIEEKKFKHCSWAGADNPLGPNFYVNRKASSLWSFIASLKRISSTSDFIHIIHDLINVYSRRSGSDNPRGQNLDVNRNLLSLRSFATSLKKISLSLILYDFFHDFMHVYRPRAGADSLQGQSFDFNKNVLSLHSFVSSLKKMSLKSDFIQFFSWFNTCILPRGRDRQPPGDNILMSTERPYHFTYLSQVSKKSLWNLILYIFFSWFNTCI